jgi:hypothetical protein
MLVTPPNVEQPQVQHPTPKLQDVIAAARPNLSNAEFQVPEEHCTAYGDIIAMNSNDYRQTDRVYNHIDTGEAQQIHQLQRTFPLAKQVDASEMF